VQKLILQLTVAAAATAIAPSAVHAVAPYLRPNVRAQSYNWNGNYAYTPYGAPTALVVPPTAQMQTNWSWGAPSSRISRIDHQFTRDYFGPGMGGVGYGPCINHTPQWPQDTAQVGVYYVRGPWYPTQPDDPKSSKAGGRRNRRSSSNGECYECQ
jgi:hypothetical protein